MSRNGKRNLSYEKRKFDEVQNWYGTFWHNYRTSTIWRICFFRRRNTRTDSCFGSTSWLYQKYPWTLNRWTKVTVQVIDVDEYSQKISLSLRTLEDKVHSVNHRRKNILRIRIKIGFATLDKELPEWIDEAMDKLLEK